MKRNRKPNTTPTRGRLVRTLVLPLSLCLVMTSVACTRGMDPEQREQCRQARAAAAGRAVGMTIGIVLFAAILVLSQGNIGSFNGRGGRRSRRRRVAVCRERAPSPTRTTPVEVVTTVPPVAPPGHPPTPDELEAALQAVEPAFRRCAAPGSGTLIIDAAVDGASGRMRDFGMRGDAAPHTNPPCLAAVLAQLQFAPFDGEIEVHWALTY